MEDNDYTLGLETPNPTPPPIPQITMESLGYLNTAAKWSKFLAIMGFISIGLLVLLGLGMGALFSFMNETSAMSSFPFPTYLLGFIYVVLAVVYLMPVIYLNNFSNYITKAVALRDTQLLTNALSNLKSLFKYMGIATIVMIASYFLIIIGVVIFTMTRVAHTF